MTYTLREGWYWLDRPCNKGHEAPRNRFGHCVQCVREYRKAKGHFRTTENAIQWRKKNRTHLNEQRRNYNKRKPELSLIAAAKRSAKKKGIPFSLREVDIVIPDVCPVLGIPICRGAGSRTDNSPSLDRIVPDFGYVKGNVAVISWRANRLKQDASIDEMRKLVAFYEKGL